MIRRPRERILQMLIYEHYVRPQFDFFELATAERRLIQAFDLELNGGAPSTGAEDLVRRWFDKAWRRAEREWSELRNGGKHAFYGSRVESSSLTDEERCQAELSMLSPAPPPPTPSPPEPSERAQLALPSADPGAWEGDLPSSQARPERGALTVSAKPGSLS